MSLPPRLIVDLDAIAANYRALTDQVAPAACSAVIKADGYGMGAIPLARRLAAEGCETFWTAHLSEALAVRQALGSSDARVLVLNGPSEEAVSNYLENAVTPVLNTLEEARRWALDAPDQPAAMHLDTGMNRLGLPAIHDEAIRNLTRNRLNIVHWLSHLACADEPDRSENRLQLDRFNARLARLPKATASFANSAGCFLAPDFHFDLTRPGLALYGAQPVIARQHPLSIPYRFEAPTLQVRTFSAGDCFGYGGTATASRDGYSATVGAGYADGVPRSLSNKGHIWIGGIKAPILGRVSMDSTIVDVSTHPSPETLAGGWAQIYSENLSVDEQAASSGLSAYELLTRIGGRTQRQHVQKLAEG